MATKDDEDQVNEDKTNGSDENFGLPELELRPLEEQAPKAEEPATEEKPGETTSTPTETFEAYAVDESKSKAPMILTIVIILVVAVAGYLIYNFVYVPGAKEKAKKEQLAREQAAAKKKAEEERLAREQAAEEERKRQEALVKATPPVGTIEVLSARTTRYYVVITSDIDDDLLMDYAKKLSAQGINLKVIPPFGGKNFHRLAIADHETFAQAQASADAAKATYGSGVWVLKY
ncbi:MAG: hypothetical protein JNN04_07680 [Cyclobacteriaceae bacterium]|nr:hypothetical protein [Cyclobacteriaceae bacterium]